jgi:hypothetical protein
MTTMPATQHAVIIANRVTMPTKREVNFPRHEVPAHTPTTPVDDTGPDADAKAMRYVSAHSAGVGDHSDRRNSRRFRSTRTRKRATGERCRRSFTAVPSERRCGLGPSIAMTSRRGAAAAVSAALPE